LEARPANRVVSLERDELQPNTVIALRSPCLFRDVRFSHMTLISLLVAIVIIGLLLWLVSVLPIPAQFKTAAYILVVLIAILVLVGYIPIGVR
jgi:heme A synthase